MDRSWLDKEFSVNVGDVLKLLEPTRLGPTFKDHALATFDETVPQEMRGPMGSSPPRTELWVTPEKWANFAQAIGAPKELWYPSSAVGHSITEMER